MSSNYNKIIWLLLLIKYVTLQINIESEDCKFKQIIETVTHLANENFNFRLQTVIVSKDVDGVIVDNFLNKFKGTVVIDLKRDELPPKQVVIFLESFKSFRKIVDILKPDLKGKSLLYSGARFIIVVLWNSHRIERIFRILWSYYVTNVVLIMTQKNMTALYTYYPYRNRTNCQNTQPFFLGFVKKSYLITVNVYPDKMKNMQECPLYISTNELHQSVNKQKIQLQIIMETMVRLLREVMNFTAIISTKDNVRIDLDRGQNWSDSLNDVIIGDVNISTSSIALGVEKLGFIDYTFPYFRMSIVWLSPPTKSGYVWLRLLSPLKGYMWLILLLLFLFLKSLLFVIRVKSVKNIFHRHFKGIHKLKGVAFRIWGVMVGQPVRVSPKRFRDFYVIGLWMWFKFVVRSAYQSVLIGALKTETVVGNFASLTEAIDNGYKFGGRAGILMNFEHDPQIRDEYEIIPEVRFKEMFNNVLDGNKKFVLATSLEYAWAYCLSRGIKENECGHILPESIMTLPLVVWMKKNSPFMKPLSIWLQRFLESGLLERDTIKPGATVATQASLNPTPLTRNQTISCFLCLLGGYVLSVILFCLETLKVVTQRF